MSKHLSRRDFVAWSLTAGASSAALGLAGTTSAAAIKPQAGVDKLTTYAFGPQIWIRWADEQLTCYRAHPTQKYPYFYPLTGPLSGLSLTTESGSSYPHHRSMLFACDRVNGANYWQGDVGDGQIISRGPKLGACTPETAEILDECEWRQPGKAAVMSDRRLFKITVVGPRLRTIDVQITWTAVTDATITKTNHSLFSIRAALDITPWGGGKLISSQGQEGEKGTFGQRATWCAFWGKRKGNSGVIEGIALLDHPQNPWSPCPWFTRDYGFMSPTPMNFLEKPFKLAAGKSLSLRYRVILFAGDPKEAEIERNYQAWAA